MSQNITPNTNAARTGIDSDQARFSDMSFPDNCLAEQYETLIAPLFKLPDRLPPTSWAGHIPFLFVLFRLLRPRKYVELGVYKGASLIAACAAAKSFCVSSTMHGIDTWAGDPHIGNFDGDALFRELQDYLRPRYPEAELIRASFLESRRKFADGSIDVLNIDGYHTYEAVKDDFITWFSAVSPQGVILFHDINVYDRLFGVHRLWVELKEKFKTIEFPHSHGLGVLFLDPSDARLVELLQVFERPASRHFYQNLVIDIANSLPERMAAVSEPEQAAPTAGELEQLSRMRAADSLLDRLFRSRILRVLGPMSKTWRRAAKERRSHGQGT